MPKVSLMSLGLLALKLLKSTKLILAALSLAAYSLLFGWQMAMVFLVGLVAHEYGHVWAMKRCGIPTSGFYLIPFVGGVCSPKRPFIYRFEEAYVASMGPVFGLLATPVCFALGYALSQDLTAAAKATSFVIFLNLFNLLPVQPLDGGRMVRASLASFSPIWTWVCLGITIILGLGLAYFIPAPILVFVVMMGVMEAWEERRARHVQHALQAPKALAWLGAYLALGLICIAGLWICAYLANDFEFLHILRTS